MNKSIKKIIGFIILSIIIMRNTDADMIGLMGSQAMFFVALWFAYSYLLGILNEDSKEELPF